MKFTALSLTRNKKNVFSMNALTICKKECLRTLKKLIYRI